MNVGNIRAIAFYLPQYHPIPENDIWWGKGFTEWTNVSKAKKYFPGHYQPRIPADLGYYDLRVAETRQAQADMAKEHAIEGFAYWHYWFGNGKQLLEGPFNEVLKSGEPNFPFCLSWANETWKGFHHGLTNRNVLIEQLYLGIEDIEKHFYEVLPAFLDKRYITVQDKPLFTILQPLLIPDTKAFIEQWQNLAIKNGLKGIYFVGQSNKFEDINKILEASFDAVNINRLFDFLRLKKSLPFIAINLVKSKIFGVPHVYDFGNASKFFTGKEDSDTNCIPTIISGWDHSPRSGKNGLVLHKATPELFEQHVIDIFQKVKHKPSDERIVFIKSWNEWAEGNYLEPDMKYGTGFLEAFKRAVLKC